MEAWERWWLMAHGSLAASKLLIDGGQFRSSASRSYYAAYQASSAVLLYMGTTPPEDREAWSHEATPGLLRQRLGPVLTRSQCFDMARRLGLLYKLRVEADYISIDGAESKTAAAALKDASFMVKVVREILAG